MGSLESAWGQLRICLELTAWGLVKANHCTICICIRVQFLGKNAQQQENQIARGKTECYLSVVSAIITLIPVITYCHDLKSHGFT